MTDTTTPADEPGCEVPLIEQLRSVPIDARQMIEVHATEHRNIPYGHLCHAAADALEARSASQPAQEPVWTQEQIDAMNVRAAELMAKMRPAPMAADAHDYPYAVVKDSQPAQEPVRLPGFIRREVERAIDDAINPKGMSVHDGKATIGADKLQYMLRVIDAYLAKAKP